MPTASPRRAAGKAFTTAVSTSGCTRPAEKPCRMRPNTSVSMLGALAPITAPAANTTSARQNAFRWPKACTAQVLSSWLATMVARNAVAAHCARSWPTPKAPMMLGTATLTMVAESTVDIAPSRPPTTTGQREASLAGGNPDLDHHPGAQARLALRDRNPHRHALRHLGEVAARVGRGQQREAAGRGLPDALDAALEVGIRIRVDVHLDPLPDRQARELGLLDVGLDPDARRVVHQQEALAGADVLARLDE